MCSTRREQIKNFEKCECGSKVGARGERQPSKHRIQKCRRGENVKQKATASQPRVALIECLNLKLYL